MNQQTETDRKLPKTTNIFGPKKLKLATSVAGVTHAHTQTTKYLRNKMPVTTRSMKKMSPAPAPRPYLVITTVILRPSPAPAPRRSARLAAKPPVSYREVEEDHEPSVTVIEDGDRPVYREYQDDVCRWCGRVHAPYVPYVPAPTAPPAQTLRDSLPEAERIQHDKEVTTIKNMLNNVEDAVGAENKTVQSIALFEFLLTNHLIVAASPKFRNTVLSKIVELEEQVKVKSVSPYRVDCFNTVAKHVRLMIDGLPSSHPHYRV
jgi:hypothetical protein